MNTPSSERLHISLFGCCNAGKSTVANLILGQDLCIISETKGTTTDPVSKSMELLPLGPVVITDTPGYDDEGNLGNQRISKTMKILDRTDIAIIIADEKSGLSEKDKEFLQLIKDRKIPSVTVINTRRNISREEKTHLDRADVIINAMDNSAKKILLDAIIKTASEIAERKNQKNILDGLVSEKSTVVLVCPIDDAAPKGRLILPQQLVLRNLLDIHAKAVVVQPEELKETIEAFKIPPELVITDSQAFREVSEILPEEIPLTSFSILMARYKGFLEYSVRSIDALEKLNEGDRILIAEGCTHHRQCGDIGSVKIPMALKKITGRNLNIEFSSGTEFPENLKKYSMIIHCGGCMLNEAEILSRMNKAKENDIPFCNYGIFLAHAGGILKRSISMLNE